MYNIRFGRDGEHYEALDDYGFPRVHNFNIPSLRFEDLEARLALTLPHRVSPVSPAEAPDAEDHAVEGAERPVAETVGGSNDGMTSTPVMMASQTRQLTMLVHADSMMPPSMEHGEGAVLTAEVEDMRQAVGEEDNLDDAGSSDVDLREIFENAQPAQVPPPDVHSEL